VKVRLAAAGAAALAAATVPVVPAAAHAAAVRPAATHAAPATHPVAPRGWNGKCYTNWHTKRAVNMWCDGKGPERYSVSVVCTKGRRTYQYNSPDHPWFGDRRGATATCRRGRVTTWWGYPAG
jgi:hypothetical protein